MVRPEELERVAQEAGLCKRYKKSMDHIPYVAFVVPDAEHKEGIVKEHAGHQAQVPVKDRVTFVEIFQRHPFAGNHDRHQQR